MRKIRVAIVGAGNISNTRHIPALKKIKDVDICGVVGVNKNNIDRTIAKYGIPNYLLLENQEPEKLMSQCDWFRGVDAVIIGTPPMDHYMLVKSALMNDKHVLVEKPMTMSKLESDELIKLAKTRKKILYVMHNFQFADKMSKLNDIIKTKRYGDIVSITETQFTNHDRRLPDWYNELPFGLFYDEAAHFLYLLELHGGKVVINSSYAVYDNDKEAQTPVSLTVNALAGSIPVTMLINFHSPICEWHYVVNFEKHILIYDFFKDILIDLPTDNEHLAKDIFYNSISFSYQYWSQFIKNGFKMIRGNLLYGHDKVMNSFIDCIRDGKAPDSRLVAENGKTNVESIHDIVNKANKRSN